MSTLLGKLWRWSLWPALVVVAATTLGAWSVLRHYERFAIDLDARVSGLELGSLAQEALLRGLRDVAPQPALPTSSPSPPSGGQPLFRRIEVDFDDEAKRRLDARLPYSGQEYQPATLRSDGIVREVDLRYRGDLYTHWGHTKKSLRIRTKKSEVFEGMRHFNLVVPKGVEVLNNYLSAWLARELGLLAPRVEVVRVAVRGEDHGLFVMTDQIDESLLRTQRRMPGGIFAGEVFMLDSWTGVPMDLFARAGLWKQVEKPDAEPEVRRAPLEALSDLLRRPMNSEVATMLSDRLDIEAFARLSVLEQLTQSSHLDGLHNWRLYFDAWRRRFEPIVWDLVGWHEAWRPAVGDPLIVHPCSTVLHEALHSNLAFLEARDRCVRDFFARGIDERLLHEVERMNGIVDLELPSDRHRAVRSDTATKVARAAFVAFVKRCVEALRATWTAPDVVAWCRLDAARHDSVHLYRVLVQSDRVMTNLTLDCAHETRVARICVAIERGEGVVEEVDLGAAWQRDGKRIHVSFPLACGFARHLGFDGKDPVRNQRLVAIPTTYVLRIETEKATENEKGAGFVVQRMLIGERVADARSAIEPTAGGASLEAGFRLPAREPIVLRGSVEVRGEVLYHDRVRIEAGTTIALARDAVLVFRGGVEAVGRPDARIRFVPIDATDPAAAFAAIAVEGKRAIASRFEYCDLRGGRGQRDADGVRSGLLSIVDATSVRIVNCNFKGTAAVEDVVHCVYSDVEVVGSAIEGGIDGIDCDLGSLVVRDSTISAGSGDGLDLMDSSGIVERCRLALHGDKGLSVGERSKCLVVDSVVEACSIGIEVKDGSRAQVHSSDFLDCATSVRAAEKNWRYASGGEVLVARSCLAEREHTVDVSGRSRVTIVDCKLEASSSESKKSSGAHFVDCDRAQEAKGTSVPAIEPGLRALLGHDLLHRARRGARLTRAR